MKLKSKLMAAAIALVAASGANAAIDNGAGGNGELFFNIWDANGSYTRDLNLSIDSFESTVNAAGAFHLTYATDSLMNQFFAGTSTAGARTGAFKFDIVATDTFGARRILNTFTEPTISPTITSTIARTAATAAQTFVNNVNTPLGANESVAVNNASAAWAGKAAFKDTIGGSLNFSNAGTLANSSYATGLSFMSLNAASTGSGASVYAQYFDPAVSEVHVYFDAANTLHIQSVAAIPEPSEYALMLAGLGMLGFMARRRLNNRA